MKIIYILLMFLTGIIYSQWNVQTTFSPAQSIYAIKFYDENTGYCVAPLYNSSTYNIHKTTNAGQNWVEQSSGYTGMRFMGIFILNPDTVYMSGNEGLIIKTVNGGQNWVTINSEATLQLWGLWFTNSFTGYTCGSSGRIMKTTNAGTNWVNQTSPVLAALSAMYFINENTGFICGSTVAFKTTNGGANWINMNAPFVNFETFRDLHFFDANTGLYVSDLGRIGKTTNGGANWALMNSGTTQTIMGVWFVNNNTGYACGYNGTIIKSTDAGDNWTSQVSPVNEILPDICFTSANTGYISTWYGKVLKTTNGGVTFINQLGNEIPHEFSLSQNYPNPFNPETNIQFEISKEGAERIQLKVYDLLGREISTLVNEYLQPGIYKTVWNAGNNTSGIYYYKLTAGSFTETKKMVLVK